ncbi:MAG: ATP-binding cassette domain-containing protein, partial [Wenzhouxiangellaceae bacterium]
FGKPKDDVLLERILRQLSLWDKRDSRIMELSGGMKRRVLIAKALAHEPRLLFLDEPSAGVDVELRRDMWALIRRLRDTGVTIVLTTHYIEEAEQMADRVGVILGGRLVIVEQTEALMRRLGQKQLTLHLEQPMTAIPEALSDWSLELADHGQQLVYSFSAEDEQTGVPALIRCLHRLEIEFTDLNTRQSSLEDIFVDLIRERK